MGRRKRKIIAARELEVDPSPKDVARFRAKTRAGTTIPDGYDTPCIEWAAGLDADGYGRFWFQGRNTLAHRFAYAYEVGPIRAGYDVDHGCANRCCVNADHLDQKAPAINRPAGRWRGHNTDAKVA